MVSYSQIQYKALYHLGDAKLTRLSWGWAKGEAANFIHTVAHPFETFLRNIPASLDGTIMDSKTRCEIDKFCNEMRLASALKEQTCKFNRHGGDLGNEAETFFGSRKKSSESAAENQRWSVDLLMPFWFTPNRLSPPTANISFATEINSLNTIVAKKPLERILPALLSRLLGSKDEILESTSTRHLRKSTSRKPLMKMFRSIRLH